MKQFYEKRPLNFGAIAVQDFKKAKIVIVPVSYDATSYYKKGAKEGPREIILASRNLDELTPDESGKNMLEFRATDIFTLEEIVPTSNSAEEAIKGVEQAIGNEVLAHGKFPLMLGGEHSITLGAVRAVRKKYQDLSVLQFDAHSDLLDEIEGTRFSHACVMRRIQDENIKTAQIGIRNFDPEIKTYIKKKKCALYPAPRLPNPKEVAGHLTRNVYLTFDLDFFDPAIMPATGTPEPGGFYWYETIKFIEEICKRVNVVGADVVELSPTAGLHAPNFLASKLVYNIMKNVIKKI